MKDNNASQANERIEKKIYVSAGDVKEAAWNQFKEGNGTSHRMELVKQDGGLYLVYTGGRAYKSDYENPTISGYEVAEFIDFDSELAQDGYGKEKCLNEFGGVVDEVDIGGETYAVEVSYW